MVQHFPTLTGTNRFTAPNRFKGGVAVGAAATKLTSDGALRVSGHILGSHPVLLTAHSATTHDETVTLTSAALNAYHSFTPVSVQTVTLPTQPWVAGDCITLFNASLPPSTPGGIPCTLVVQVQVGVTALFTPVGIVGPGQRVQYVWDGAGIRLLAGIGSPRNDSLTGCTGCVGCSGCTGCTGCINCVGCTGCTGCANSSNCTGCTGCISCSGLCVGCTACISCVGCTSCVTCFFARDLTGAASIVGGSGSTPTVQSCESWTALASFTPPTVFTTPVFVAMHQVLHTGLAVLSFNPYTNDFTVLTPGSFEVRAFCCAVLCGATTLPPSCVVRWPVGTTFRLIMRAPLPSGAALTFTIKTVGTL